ncbi:hypothetical protein DAEQUDRAFT_769812 [Daedalea quercina L-15889]|uniref:Uncharacterized protein n=1 Tax=Daedalea quercina L-15889 TaxID=1314783 RepID=A0A165LE68_9APHY|nr:hypothetical protein DAEQUDRAFT_769812 [Daedalea quercina L-15889]
MANVANVSTIHNIIDSVRSHAATPSEQSARERATYLAVVAHTILTLIRNDMDNGEIQKYNGLYAMLQAQAVADGDDSEQYLKIAEALWTFTLQTFQSTTHRKVTGHAQPAAVPPLGPSMQAVQAQPTSGYAQQGGLNAPPAMTTPSANVIVLPPPCCHRADSAHASPYRQTRPLSPLPLLPAPPPPRTPTPPPPPPPPPSQAPSVYVISTPWHSQTLPLLQSYAVPSPSFSPGMFPVATPIQVPMLVPVPFATPVKSPRMLPQTWPPAWPIWQ